MARVRADASEPRLPTFGKSACGAPENVMFHLFRAKLFETEDLAALRIDSGHDVPNGAVLAARVHSLKNQKQRIAVGGPVKALM